MQLVLFQTGLYKQINSVAVSYLFLLCVNVSVNIKLMHGCECDYTQTVACSAAKMQNVVAAACEHLVSSSFYFYWFANQAKRNLFVNFRYFLLFLASCPNAVWRLWGTNGKLVMKPLEQIGAERRKQLQAAVTEQSLGCHLCFCSVIVWVYTKRRRGSCGGEGRNEKPWCQR